MREPDLKSLKVFACVAQHLNFRLAAEDLNVTRGAIAQQIRQMESDVGVKLFYRLPRGLKLTQHGEQYHLVIQQALLMIDEATQSLMLHNDTVTIGMTPSMAAKWLLPKLPSFEKQFPDIDLQVVVKESVSDIQSDNVDISILYGDHKPEISLIAENQIALNLLAVCSPDYAKNYCVKHATDNKLTEFKVKKPSTFLIHRLIQDNHQYWDGWFKDMDLQPAKHKLVFNQTTLSIDAAINGQGVTLVPSILVSKHLEQGDLVALWNYSAPNNQGYYLAYSQPAKLIKTAVHTVREWLGSALYESIAPPAHELSQR